MKLKPITLLVAIIFAITMILSVVNLIDLLSLDSDSVTVKHIVVSAVYVLRDAVTCLFFLILYKNQK